LERPQAESGYISTLDGWRTVAIGAVLISHANVTMTSLGFSRQAISVAAWGRLGVDLFFAISGYLICGRLLAEREAAGSISLKNFYIRRLFRILPLYYGYLAVLVALAVFAGVAVTKTEIVSSIFFYRNYVPMSASVYTNHFWSLAVEEHFYLFWPFFLVAVGPRAALWTTPILALSVHVWRAADSRLHLFPTFLSEAGILHRTDTRIDAILWGCVAALLCAKYPRLIFPGWVSWSVLATLLGAIVFAALPLLLAVLFPCLIVSTSRSPQSSMARILEWSWMRWLGRM
jgi:peptidoglycan/LPS O-acetylase OafA/YrhL